MEESKGKMRRSRGKRFWMPLLLLFCLSRLWCVFGKIEVRIKNQLGKDRILNIHCQSGDDDLGYVALPDGCEFEWKFGNNFWGTTLFYCNVQWDESGWHHFDAYAYAKFSDRCQTVCAWIISNNGVLLNLNQATGNWDVIPFKH